MRMSHFFSQTRWETPADAGEFGHRLLIWAGYNQPLVTGRFSILPLRPTISECDLKLNEIVEHNR